MKYQALALLTAVGSATAQGVTDKIAPTASAPAGCDASFDSTFEIVISSPENLAKRDAIINQNKKRSACPSNGVLVSELQDGVITDSHKRTGYIASNYQFQFDEPPQAGAIYTAGFSYCKNGSLALGGSSLFYQCQSGTFSNLYDRYWAPQCSPVEMMAMPCGGHEEAVSTNDEHVVATSFTATTVVVPLSDGQPQVLTTSLPIRLCQIDDGQVQGHTTPCASITRVAELSIPPVSQLSDGQIQVPSIIPSEAPPAPSATVTPPPASVSVPVPSASGVPNGTTLSSAVPPGSPSSGVSVPTTSAPAVSNTGRRIEGGSVVALAAVFVGAAWFL